MTDQDLAAMGVTDPHRPVTRGEVAAYLARIILAERRRIAWAVASAPYREDQAERIADQRLDPAVFGWG